MALYPLKFKPRLLEKIWGGRKFESQLDKSLPAGKLIGESWEVYDFPPGVIDLSKEWVSSTIANGPLAGRTLHELIEEQGPAVMGEVALSEHGQFPVLVKFLDAREDLSIQVHPDQRYAAAQPEAYLKTEAWYVVQSDPGAKIYKGLKPDVSREQFEHAIETGTVENLVKQIEVKPGQCHFLPSGIVHALGGGILAAEVQTPSDTTFRVYDFNRVEAVTGKPRTLHIRQSLECIDFSGKPEAVQKRSHVASYFTTVTRLVTTDFFTVEKVRFTEGVEEAVPYDQPVVWLMLEGSLEIKVDDLREPVRLTKGEPLLLPARMKNPRIKTLSDCVWLETTFPSKTA
jgi:mannose-6-phosphate isomerase